MKSFTHKHISAYALLSTLGILIILILGIFLGQIAAKRQTLSTKTRATGVECDKYSVSDVNFGRVYTSSAPDTLNPKLPFGFDCNVTVTRNNGYTGDTPTGCRTLYKGSNQQIHNTVCSDFISYDDLTKTYTFRCYPNTDVSDNLDNIEIIGHGNGCKDNNNVSKTYHETTQPVPNVISPTTVIIPTSTPVMNLTDPVCGYMIDRVDLSDNICTVTINNGIVAQDVYINCIDDKSFLRCDYKSAEVNSSGHVGTLRYQCPQSINKVCADTFNKNCLNDNFPQHWENGKAVKYCSNVLGEPTFTPPPVVIANPTPTASSRPGFGSIEIYLNLVTNAPFSTLDTDRFLKFTLYELTGASSRIVGDPVYFDAASKKTYINFPDLLPGQYFVELDTLHLYKADGSGGYKIGINYDGAPEMFTSAPKCSLANHTDPKCSISVISSGQTFRTINVNIIDG